MLVRVLFDESKIPALILAIDVSLQLVGELVPLLDLLALVPLEHVGDGIPPRDVPRIGLPERLVIRVGRTIPLIKAVVRRPASVFVADVPFASAESRVTTLREEVVQRLLPRDQAAPAVAGQGHRMRS